MLRQARVSEEELEWLLFRAIEREQASRVAQLLADGASANALVPVGEQIKRGEEPQGNYIKSMPRLNFLQWACATQAPAPVVQALLEAGADIGAKAGDFGTPLRLALVSTPNATDKNAGLLEVVRVLLKGGADAAQKSYYGETPLIDALRCAPHEQRAELALELIQAGCPLTKGGSQDLWEAVGSAGRNHDPVWMVRCLDVLIEAGARPAKPGSASGGMKAEQIKAMAEMSLNPMERPIVTALLERLEIEEEAAAPLTRARPPRV